MYDRNSIIVNLFSLYHSLLPRILLSWVIIETEKVVVHLSMADIRASTVRARIESDLGATHHLLREHINGFMKQASILAEAFSLIKTAVLRQLMISENASKHEVDQENMLLSA